MKRVIVLAAAAALVGAVPAVTAPAVAAGGGSLTVTTIDRHGHVVTSILRAIRLKDGAGFAMRSGHTRRLPPGRYDVVVDIVDRHDHSATAAVKRVTVDGAETLVIDARHGRRVVPALRPAPPADYVLTTGLEICIAGSAELAAWPDEFPLYAIPSGLSEVSLGLNTSWVPVGYAAPGPQFVGVVGYTGGIPSRIAPIIRQSALATLLVHGRAGYLTGQRRLELRGSGGACRGNAMLAQSYPTIPYTVAFHVTPGSWTVAQEGDESPAGIGHRYAAGRRYAVTLAGAVKGPGARLPITDSYSRELLVGPVSMFTGVDRPFSMDEAASFRLTHGRVVVLDRHDVGSVQPRLPGRGWYTLVVSARRRADGAPAAGLSTRSSLRLHFFADPGRDRQVADYVTLFRPAGLDRTNAAAGPRTTVALRLVRSRPDAKDVERLPDRVKAVHAWYSTDAGRTWHAVRVVHSGGHWRVSVPNPSAGYVSLRSRVDDTRGGWATTTVIRAYAVR